MLDKKLITYFYVGRNQAKRGEGRVNLWQPMFHHSGVLRLSHGKMHTK